MLINKAGRNTPLYSKEICEKHRGYQESYLGALTKGVLIMWQNFRVLIFKTL